VWLGLDGQAARGSKPTGQCRKQTQAMAQPLASRVVPRSRVGLTHCRTRLEDERPGDGGAFDIRRPRDPEEPEPFAGSSAERAAGPLLDDGGGLVEQTPDNGLESRGTDSRRAAG